MCHRVWGGGHYYSQIKADEEFISFFLLPKQDQPHLGQTDFDKVLNPNHDIHDMEGPLSLSLENHDCSERYKGKGDKYS